MHMETYQTKDVNVQEEAQEMTQSQPSVYIVGSVGVDTQSVFLGTREQHLI